MHVTNDVLLLLLTPIVVIVLVVIYTVQSATNRILRIEPTPSPKRLLSQILDDNREIGAILPSSTRHLTVLINPCSGSKNANAIFESLRPSLEQAGLILNIIETTCKGQAYRIATQISQQDCDGIVCVGGDGTVHEVVNGLLSRSDATIARHIPIAVIPCGSSNELAHTLGIYTPQQAAVKLIRGTTRPLDILAITSTPPDMWLGPGRTLYSFQGIGWGLTSEMISVAERLRWWISSTPLSTLRLTLAAILTILTTLTLPRYSAKLMFLPLPTQNSPNLIPTISNTNSSSSSSLHSTNDDDTKNNYNNNNNVNSNNDNTGAKINLNLNLNRNPNSNLNLLNNIVANRNNHSDAYHQAPSHIDVCAVNNSQCAGCEQPIKYNKGKRPSSDLKDWVVVDGKTDGLLFFSASNTPGKLSPHAHLSDGYMDVSLITHCSRLRLTRLLMKDDKLEINEHQVEASSAPLITKMTTPMTTSMSAANTEACIMHPLPNSGYHIRQYKTAHIHLEVDRNLPLIVDGELLEAPPPPSSEPQSEAESESESPSSRTRTRTRTRPEPWPWSSWSWSAWSQQQAEAEEACYPLSLDVEVLRSLCNIVC